MRKLKKILNTILDHTVTYGLLLNFCNMASLLNHLSSVSNVKADVLTNNSGEIIGYSIVFKELEGDIQILLDNDSEEIDIKYPISEKTTLNYIYTKEISKSPENYDNTITPMISKVISSRIYNFLISYMKGEFDNANDN